MDQNGKEWRWEIEPHPYDSQYDTYVTDSDEEARTTILNAAESYLWDTNDGIDDGPDGKSTSKLVRRNYMMIGI